MRSAKRGIFVIISNEHYVTMRYRVGADADIIMLRDAFTKLGFDVRVHSNLTAEQACQVLKQGLRENTPGILLFL